MPPRQVWLFQFGCWSALATAIIHIAIAMLVGTGDATLYLLFAVPFAAVGSMGIVVIRRGQSDPLLMYGIARSAAVTSAALLLLSLSYFSIYPGMLIVAVTTCFAVSAVKAPGI